MIFPNISKEKRDEGLKKARQYKTQRAQIKKSIKNGSAVFNTFFTDGNFYSDVIANMKLIDMIRSIPGIGEIKAKKIMKTLRISRRKTIKGLSTKQRENFRNYFKIN
ncbi:MAG: integration host factor, actinobacterial type [Candidatus Humimicrobiaceae bacterium]